MNSQIYSQNNITTQLLKLIDKQRPSKPNQQTILQSPANIFTIIRQMYNSFKKDNQSRILQNKIYELTIYDTRKDISKTKIKKQQCTSVKLQHLFQNHTKSHTAELIHNLMILKSFLQTHLRVELIHNVSKQVSKIDDLSTILKLYKKILKAKECIEDKQLYKTIQNQMITKVLSLTSSLLMTKECILQISNFILSLPYLQIQILELIGIMFERLREISEFDPLKPIYENIYKKISGKNKLQSYQNKIVIQSFLKVTTQQHIQIVREKSKKIIQEIKNNSNLTEQNKVFLQIFEEQSIRNMVNNYPKLKIMGEMIIEQQNLKQKQKKIIDLIFIALQTQFFINLVYPSRKNTKLDVQKQNYKDKLQVLTVFIGWYHNCCKNSIWNYYISEKTIQFIQKIFQIPSSLISLIKILLERQAGYNKKQDDSSNMIINLNESVSNFIIRQLLSNIASFNRYLSNKHAKQLVAYGLMNDQFDMYEQIIINPSNLDFIDIMLQIFSSPNPIQFFRKILSNQIKRTNFQRYLSALLQEKQKKYKDFFMKVDSYKQGQIFQIQDHFLLKYFRSTATMDIIVSFFRDMTMYLPSKLCIEIMKSFIEKFKPKGQHKIIYSQAIRTLNVILSTRNASELSVQFKMHLKQIVELKIIEGQQVFKNVPIKMTNDLAQFYISETK